MHKHSRSTVLGLAVLGLALIAAPAFAANLFTVNHSDTEGATGSMGFVPAFLSSNDSRGVMGSAAEGGIYIPYMGTMTPCAALIGEVSITTGVVEAGIPDTGGCSRWGQASLEAWANGLYYDPRFGTPFIPPSGDHHRTGYRLLMQPSFSGGAWLTGFAPLNQRFPFMPEVGTQGAGGDVGLALANASAQTGLNEILRLVDAHGEALTTGKFPRYWPHERAAWVDTLMVKYTAGSGSNVGSKFTQSLRTSVGFLRDTTGARWRAMSNVDGHFSLGGNADGCGGPWCEFYVTVDANGDNHLWVTKGADGNTLTDTEGVTSEITESTRIDTMSAATFSGGVGKILRTQTLNNLEKLPTLIDDRLAQVDTDLDGTQPGGNEEMLPGEGEGFGVDAGGNPVSTAPAQALFSQVQILSGPNFHSEEGSDPYAWVICGTRGMEYGEDDCSVGGGAIDSGGANYAIVFNSNFQGQLGDSVLKRFGRDLNPHLSNDQGNGFTVIDPVGDPDQDSTMYVKCDTPSACLSSPGADLMYGTADDGTIYYKEAIENGLRGWIRETNGHAFSFLGARLANGEANFGLTTMMQQNIGGFLMSCLGCNPHSLPTNVETLTYQFDWPGNFNIADGNHPPLSTETITILTP
jgi:hypothetical protein